MTIIDLKNKIIFYTPRKVGSTTIENILFELIDEKSKNISKIIYKHGVFMMFHPFIENTFKKIIFLRNPTDQIISWFFWDKRDEILKLKDDEKIISLFFSLLPFLLKSNDEFYDCKYNKVFYFEQYSIEFKKFLKETYENIDIFDKIYNSENKTLKKNVTNKEIKEKILERMNESHKNMIKNHFKKFKLFDKYYK